MQYNLFRKGIIYAIIILIIGTNIIPSYGTLSSEKSSSKENHFYDCSIEENPGLSLVTLMVASEIGGDNWYSSENNFTFTHESEDIAEIHYSIEGNWTEYTSPFKVSESGEHILEWYAVDIKGNHSEIDGPFYFTVDPIPPQIDPDGVHWEAFQDGLFGDWYVRFWTNATDELSGMDRVEMYFNEDLYKVNDTPEGTIYDFIIKWSTKYETGTFYFIHYDKAGNTVVDEILGNEPSIPFINLQKNQIFVSSTETFAESDQTYRNKSLSNCPIAGDFKLSSLIVIVNRKIVDNDWIVSDVNLSFLYEPEDITTVYYKIDDEDWILYSEPLVISSDGNHEFSWYIVDYEGNTSTPDSISFKIDQTPPSINLTIEKLGMFKYKLIADVFDNASGVKKIIFNAEVSFFLFGVTLSRDQLYFTDYTFPYEWNISGWRSIEGYARVYDKAGHCATHPISASYDNFHLFSFLQWLLGILGWLT